MGRHSEDNRDYQQPSKHSIKVKWIHSNYLTWRRHGKVTIFKYEKGREKGKNLFVMILVNKWRRNGHKLQQEGFGLGIRLSLKLALSSARVDCPGKVQRRLQEVTQAAVRSGLAACYGLRQREDPVTSWDPFLPLSFPCSCKCLLFPSSAGLLEKALLSENELFSPLYLVLSVLSAFQMWFYSAVNT